MHETKRKKWDKESRTVRKRIVLAVFFCMVLAGLRVYAGETDQAQEVIEAKECGVIFTIPDEYRNIKGRLEIPVRHDP